MSAGVLNVTNQKARRYDIDAVRFVAFVLLIFVHAQASFSEQAKSIMLINPSILVEDSSFFDVVDTLYVMLSVWRLPILFLVAGMAAKFSLENRTLVQFSLERIKRIGIPLIFGSVVVVPIAFYLAKKHYTGVGIYIVAPGHLWFLVNIIIYVFLLAGVLSVIKASKINFQSYFNISKRPVFVVAVFAITLMIVAAIINPKRLGEWYAGNHTPLFGLACFIAGYVFAKIGDVFREWTEQNLYLFLLFSSALFFTRLIYIGQDFGIERFEISQNMFNALSALEAAFWIISVLGISGRLVKKSSRFLSYATLAIFPIYIVHYPVQNLIALVFQELHLSRTLIFLLLILVESIICVILFEAIKKIKWFRALFGLRA